MSASNLDDEQRSAHRSVTEPMKIMLLDTVWRNADRVRVLYPYGQHRLIMQGLWTRALIDEQGRLTIAGTQLARALHRASVRDADDGDPEAVT